MSGMIKNLYDGFTIIWYIVFIIFFIVIYYLNSKPYRAKLSEIMIKTYPAKLRLAELSMLLYKKIIPEVFTASILMLFYKRKINIKKTENDYIFTINEESDYIMEKDQEYLLNFLFDSIAFDNSLKLSDIEKYAGNKNDTTDFFTNYYVWKRIAQSETFNHHFYETKVGYQLIIIYKYITILLVLINFFTHYHSIIVYLLIFLSLFLNLYFYKTYRRTKESNDEYHKWKEFKNYLSTFSEEKVDLDEQQIFYFLMYGTILRETTSMNNEVFKGMDKLVIKLNEVVKKCVLNAELHGRREIKWK